MMMMMMMKKKKKKKDLNYVSVIFSKSFCMLFFLFFFFFFLQIRKKTYSRSLDIKHIVCCLLNVPVTCSCTSGQKTKANNINTEQEASQR